VSQRRYFGRAEGGQKTRNVNQAVTNQNAREHQPHNA
jgi:hypothetical protein